MTGYSPEDYEALKDFYKKDIRERKAILERLRLQRLRQKAEWHLKQVENALRQFGIESADEHSPPASNDDTANKTLL